MHTYSGPSSTGSDIGNLIHLSYIFIPDLQALLLIVYQINPWIINEKLESITLSLTFGF